MPRTRFSKLDPTRQQAILNAAAEEFTRSGFEKASYNNIIKRAEVSKGAMYYYFDDKEDLYLTVVRRAIERIVALFDTIPDATDSDGHWQQTEEIYRRMLALMQENAMAGSLALGYVRARPHIQRAGELDDIYRQARRWFERILARGQAVGAVRVDLPMGLLVAMTAALAHTVDEWLAQHWEQLNHDNPQVLDEIAMKFVDLVRRLAVPERR